MHSSISLAPCMYSSCILFDAIKLVKTACKYIVIARLVFYCMKIACVLSRCKRGLVFWLLYLLGLLHNVILYKVYYVNMLQ